MLGKLGLPPSIYKRKNNQSVQARDFADASWVDIWLFNTDDQWEAKAPLLISGKIQMDEDGGAMALVDMPVSATPAVGTEESYSFGINGTPLLKISSLADSSGGITAETIDTTNAARIHNLTIVNAASYDVLASDETLHVTYTDTGTVAIELKTAQLIAGRVLVIKDADFNASVNNITLSTEGAEKIEEEDTAIISGDGDALVIYSDGINWFIY